MGVFEYETTLAIVNLIDTVLALTLVLITYILFRVVALLTQFIP